jgi:FkbM family methyltransferase
LFFVLPKSDFVSKIMVETGGLIFQCNMCIFYFDLSYSYQTGGMWEKPLNMLYKDLVLKERIAQPDFIPLVIDVGVNMGAFTLFAASMHSKVYGYDIQSLLLKLVHMGVAANDYSQLVILHDTAVWDQAGLNFTFSPVPGNYGGTSIVGDIKNERNKKRPTETFQVVSSRIDETFKHSSLFFIKLDCEGCEPKALLGMDSIFLKGSVSHVVIEIWPETVYILEALYYLGYICSVFDDKEDCKYPAMSKESCGMPDFAAAVNTFNRRRPYSHKICLR